MNRIRRWWWLRHIKEADYVTEWRQGAAKLGYIYDKRLRPRHGGGLCFGCGRPLVSRWAGRYALCEFCEPLFQAWKVGKGYA